MSAQRDKRGAKRAASRGIDYAKVNAGAGRPAGYENQRPHGRPGMTDADRERAAGRGDNHSVHFS
jgi:hypothetical protein